MMKAYDGLLITMISIQFSDNSILLRSVLCDIMQHIVVIPY